MKKHLLLAAIFISAGLFAQNFYLGQLILKNARYFSPNKNFYLTFQNDGNLVIYNKRNNAAIWDSKTTNSGQKALMQYDGNLVIYNANNIAVFSTNTKNRGNILMMQDDGNLVIYNKSKSPVWSSIENKIQNSGFRPVVPVINFVRSGYQFLINEKLYSTNREFYLTFQPDGNLVVYNKRNMVIWDSKTANRGGKALFQSDGNLVIYDRRGQSIFSTNSSNKNGKSLMMQNDGNLVIYTPSNYAIWASDNR